MDTEKSEGQILRENLDRYRQIIDSTPVCIKVFDNTGKLVFINQGGRKEHFIKDTDDISKWSWIDTVKEKYKPQVLEAFKNGLSGKSSRVVMEHTPEGSDHQWCEGIISPIKDKNGKTSMLLFYSVDVSDRENTKAELIKEKKGLEIRNDELSEMNKLLIQKELTMEELKNNLEQLEQKSKD